MNFFQKIIDFFKHLFGIKDTPPPVAAPTHLFPPGVPILPGWSITAGSSPGVLAGNSFSIPQAPTASEAWVSYVEQPHTSLEGKSSITLKFTITGTDPVFNTESPGNVQGPALVRLFMHQAGDNLSGIGPYAFYRWFSEASVPLALGTSSLTVPLTLENWTPVFPSGDSATGFNNCLANTGSLGFVLGGGYFAGHGICVSSGSAVFTIDSYEVT